MVVALALVGWGEVMGLCAHYSLTFGASFAEKQIRSLGEERNLQAHQEVRSQKNFQRETER